MMIEPISRELEQEVICATERYIQEASSLFNHPFRMIPIHFNLKGLSAGMYCVKGTERMIRYNPFHFAKYFQINLTETVPHEVAHYITDILYGLNKIRPHGEEWQTIMQRFGVEPKVSCDYDMAGIPVRKNKTHEYFCGCKIHHLTTYRHNRIRRRRAQYYCLSCDGQLTRRKPASLTRIDVC